MKTTFRTLELAIDFAKRCSRLRLPRHLKDQLDRASSSIPLNLAEGSAKDSAPDRMKSYKIAYGSFRESEVIIRIANYDVGELGELTDKLRAHITALCYPKRK